LFFAGEYEVTEQNYWHLLFVDDNTENCELAAKYLNEQVVLEPGEKLKVTTEVVFDKALDRLEASQFDLIILDVRLGSHEEEREEEEGIKVLEAIKTRCFIPVIFYTGLPQKVRDLQTPLIKVIENTEGLPKVLSTIKEIFSTGLPLVNRALLQHVKKVQRDYMWDFVARNWEKFGDTPDRTSLAYLLARRLAKSLDSPGIQRLAEELGDTTGVWCGEDNVHPMMYYIVPPITAEPTTGDIFSKAIDDQTEYTVLLTPSCDIDKGKAEWMLFARCLLLSEQPEYVEYAQNPGDRKAKGKIKSLLNDNREGNQPERFKFLPGVIDLPDMVVDFQQLTAISLDEFNSLKGQGQLERIASLDSPYAEALIARFTRYFGRVGVPALNIDMIIDRIEKETSESSGKETK
jgi:CheY-like chemotaxis protein